MNEERYLESWQIADVLGISLSTFYKDSFILKYYALQKREGRKILYEYESTKHAIFDSTLWKRFNAKWEPILKTMTDNLCARAQSSGSGCETCVSANITPYHIHQYKHMDNISILLIIRTYLEKKGDKRSYPITTFHRF